MEPHRLIMLFFFSALITFTSAQAQCVPSDSSCVEDNDSLSSSEELNEVIRATINPKPHLVDPNIQKICASTDYAAVCVAAVTPYLNGKTDPASVSGMAIQAAVAQTKSAIATATKIMNSPGTSHELSAILGDCIDNYKDALDNFKSASEALPAKDTGTTNSMLSAAITAFSDSTDLLHGQNKQLADLNEKLTQMTSNCLAIVSLIK